MAAFLNQSKNDSDSSDFEVYEKPPWDKEEDIPPQTPLKQINVKPMYEYQGEYYEPKEVEKFDKPNISAKLREKIDNIKKKGVSSCHFDILGPHRPVNLRKTKPRPRGLLPTKRSTDSHKKLIEGLDDADKDADEMESVNSMHAIQGGKKKRKKSTKKRTKKRKTRRKRKRTRRKRNRKKRTRRKKTKK